MRLGQIHSYHKIYEDDEDIEDFVSIEEANLRNRYYCNETNEILKIFKEKCVLCRANPIVCSFRHCGYQVICENAILI